MEILKAKITDIHGILELHKRYNINSINPDDKPDGFVTTNFTHEELQELIDKEHGITIAKDNGRIIAYAMAGSWQFWSKWPLLAYMIEKLPENHYNGQTFSIDNSYHYGPVCVDKQYRGSGVFQKIFYTSLDSMTNRYPLLVTFINQINHRSYVAHTKKVNLDTVCTFQFNNNNYFMLACPTKQSKRL